jgi:tetratricopeptide (TPR) repeat protein
MRPSAVPLGGRLDPFDRIQIDIRQRLSEPPAEPLLRPGTRLAFVPTIRVALPALSPSPASARSNLWRRGLEVKRRRRLTGAFARALALWLFFACFVSLPVRLPPDDPAFKIAKALGLPTRAENVSVEHFNLGVVYAKEGDLVRAEGELRRAVAEERNHPRTHLELGKVLARRDKTRDAIASFARAAELEPGNPTTFHVLGILHKRAGDETAAAAAFRRALELDPGRKDSRRELETLHP